jgi:hypothetical protein
MCASRLPILAKRSAHRKLVTRPSVSFLKTHKLYYEVKIYEGKCAFLQVKIMRFPRVEVHMCTQEHTTWVICEIKIKLR